MASKNIETRSGQFEMHKTAHPVELNTSPTYDTQSFNKGDDAHSEEFQEGVQRVRAITEIWSRKTLGMMFVLYVTTRSLLHDSCF